MKRILAFSLLFAAVCSSALLATEDGNQPRPEYPRNYWCTFIDAIGEPIPHAKIQIFRTNKESEKVLAKETSLDERGNLREEPGNSNRCSFIVYHPDYGLAQAKRHYTGQGIDNFIYYVPLVRRGSEADKASIWGFVLDPDKKPVAGAKIICWRVKAPSGVTLQSITTTPTVITDPNGRFRMHLPIEPSAKAYELPPGSKYQVKIDPPVGFGLILYSGQVTSGQESTIVLNRAEHFRTFVFEDANGPITDLEKLKVIRVCVRLPINRPWYIRYPDWRDGRILPLGTFEAGMYSNRVELFEKHEFEPIEVTEESPEQLVFKVKQKPADKDIIYRGQVVQCISGEPMPGVFVAAANQTNRDFSQITPSQWENLHALSSIPSVNAPALGPVRQIRPFKRIVRTDNYGRFEMTVNTSEPFESILAFEKNYLGVEYDTWREKIFTPDENNVIELPTIRLYPAATVTLEPNVAVNKGMPFNIHARWKFAKNEDIAWFNDFARCYQSAADFVVHDDFRPNKTNLMHIPAGINVQIRLLIAEHGLCARMWCCPVLTNTIKAQQGETVDLGRMTLEEEMPIFVQVVDSMGKPIEGVGVRHYGTDRKYYAQKHLTDSEGIAEFYVPPYHKGTFAVGYRGENRTEVTESITYETKGRDDANNVYTLPLSDEILYHLFK